MGIALEELFTCRIPLPGGNHADGVGPQETLRLPDEVAVEVAEGYWERVNGAARFVAESGTTEGALKGWETRRRGGAALPTIRKVGSDHEYVMKRLMGPDAAVEDAAAVVGADWDPEGGVSLVSRYPADEAMWVNQQVTGKYDILWSLEKDDGALVMKLVSASVAKDQQGKGIMTKAFNAAFNNALAAGVTRIDLLAIRDDEFGGVGYKVWPLFGFDCTVDSLSNGWAVRAAFPNAERLSDLYKTRAGQEWWERNGTDMTASFDMTEGSISRQVLREYKRRKREGGHGRAAESEAAIPKPDPSFVPAFPDTDEDLALLRDVWLAIGDAERKD